MRLGYVQSAKRGMTDRLLTELALRLRPDVAALVSPDPQDNLLLHLWPADLRWPIRQDLGRGAAACTLDSTALEGAVFRLSQDLARLPCNVPVILNKFGRQEAEGHGLRPLIAQALEAGHPIILGVPTQTEAAFHAFAGPLAEKLDHDIQGLIDFLRG
ncbi:DUF2478 domain-containing protein [Thioclava sp. GXIMD4216]|uniref:DUF2478 domain-containing protein n=1 Tax=Thioclava sp. GXIMD4216 TaxID=3131929 RepID=UPI0030CF5E19